MYTIEQNIPLPSIQWKHQHVYPFHKMNVGDSFSMTIHQANAKCVVRLASRVAAAIQAFKLHCTTKAFTYRTIDKTTVRVWRTK